MFNWLDDPLPGLKELGRVLEVGGMVMFSTLGPDTLKELRSSFPKRNRTGSTASSTCMTSATCSSRQDSVIRSWTCR